MTRIVLLLTAVPLAAVLALVLNTLLDRRLAASTAPARRAPASGRHHSRGLSIALALLASSAAQPALVQASSQAAEGCASIGCSLLVDAELVDRLWEPATDDGVVLVVQSRIPVWFDSDPEPEPEPDAAAAEDGDATPVAAASLPTTSPEPR